MSEALQPLRRLTAGLRRNAALRLLLVPDEVNLVYCAICRDGSLPRVMLDVGAHFGTTLHGFVRDGWRVYAFEPDDRNRTILTAGYGHYTNLHIDARAVSDRNAPDAAFFGSSASTGISALAPFDASHEPRGRVETIRLETACAQLAINEIGVLKTDVEGFDLNVLRGIDWRVVRPHIIVSEFEDAKTRALGYGFDDMARYLVEHGYHVLVSEWYPVIRYGHAHRWRRIARYPCELAEPKAFGNLIACRDGRRAEALLHFARPLGPGWRAFSALRHVTAS